MKCNIGHTERVLRMTVGITLMGLAGFGITGPWAWIGILLQIRSEVLTTVFRL